MGGPSGPMPLSRIAATGAESIGPEGSGFHGHRAQNPRCQALSHASHPSAR
ncbi:DUF6053 domain-containing protein [Lysobacter enzymogenes]|uniref:DUF6053 domain-containing protein n=1 Tax=Lysobacter enzymogenes TaxID=69 RepID=UPI003D18E632